MVDVPVQQGFPAGRTSQEVPLDHSAASVEPAASNRALLAEFVRINDAPCALCGYNLHNLTSDVCPECGQLFSLRIGAPNVRYHLFVACLAPMLMHVGLAAFLAAMTLRYGVPSGRTWYFVLVAAGVVNALLAIVLYARRISFLKMTASAQRGLTFVSWLLNGGVFVTATLVIK